MSLGMLCLLRFYISFVKPFNFIW